MGKNGDRQTGWMKKEVRQGAVFKFTNSTICPQFKGLICIVSDVCVPKSSVRIPDYKGKGES